MKNTNGFIVEISSDLNYENIVANILYEEETVAIISQEKGVGNFEIEIVPSFDAQPWKFSLDDFIKAILLAKKSLIES